MLVNRSLAAAPAVFLLITPPCRQFRSHTRNPFPSKVSHYLHRAKIIDLIRVATRSNDQTSLESLLGNRLMDPFIVTHAFRSCPSAEAAVSIFEMLKTNQNFAHNQSSICALATVLAKFFRRDELRSLITEINERSYKKVRVSYMDMLRWSTESGDIDGAIEVWDKYKDSGKCLSAECYNIMMRIYAQLGQDVKAVEVFCKMMEEGVLPNARTFTIMIEHLVSTGKLDSALEIFGILPSMRIKRTSKQFVELVDALAKTRRFDEGRSLLREMQNEGMLCGCDMLQSLQMMKDAGYIDEMDEALQKMLPDDRIKHLEPFADDNDEDTDDSNDYAINEEEGDMQNCNDTCNGNCVKKVKLKPWIDPRALANALDHWSETEAAELEKAGFVWTTRLVCKILRNFRSPEAAWEFFCWVACQPGFTHDIYTVQRMMTLLARHGHIRLVDELIGKIKREGLKLPFSTIKLIIDFYGISKNPDAALKVFRQDRGLCGPISNFKLMILYSSLLRTLIKSDRSTDALDILDEMILGGTFPDVQTFSGLMEYFSIHGDIKTVQKLFGMVRQSGIMPDAYMYKVLIQGYCKCERAALALRIFDDMRSSNVVPDGVTRELLVKSLWKEGKRREAAIVQDICEEIKGSLPLAITGHVWTISSANLKHVYNVYVNTFR
ncbi:hypothetical protein MLD38_007736 [Melastoma candidum]|uniref:Uncharacterized protein n=1 Tax=Melastoma candidum TaxID=119954 RepID=A0ACB9S0K8_9MYRT|nr:hypothetical protein MLD38_007736 [Melastoma candidum]